jgi:hypothetical protein
VWVLVPSEVVAEAFVEVEVKKDDVVEMLKGIVVVWRLVWLFWLGWLSSVEWYGIIIRYYSIRLDNGVNRYGGGRMVDL